MTAYTLSIRQNESAWATASETERGETYARHGAFAEALATRGHTLASGAELALSSDAKYVGVTERPYAEAAEQLTGFYLIETDDLDDLLECVAFLTDATTGVEVRGTVDHSTQPAPLGTLTPAHRQVRP